MKLLHTIARGAMTLTVFLVPFIFLPVTTEFFLTQKVYLLAIVTLLGIITIAISLVTDRKILSVKTPFNKVLFILGVTSLLTLFITTINKVQAIYSFPTGVGVILTLVLFYYVSIYLQAKSRTYLPYFKALTIGTFVAAIATIIISFNPFAQTTLPPQYAFLQNPRLSIVGGYFNSLVLFGFVASALLGGVMQDLKSKAHKGSIWKIGMIVLSGLSFGLVVYLSSKQLTLDNGQTLQKVVWPPLSVSWYAALESLKSVRTALFGIGFGNYDAIFTLVKPAAYNLSDVWTLNYSLSRSALLHIWTEMGSIAFLTVCMTIVYAIREVSVLMKKKDKNSGYMVAGGLFLLASYVVMPISVILLFVSVIYIIMLHQYTAEYEKESVQEFNLSKLPLVYLTLAVVLLAFVGTTGYFGYKAYAADVYFKNANDLLLQNDANGVYQSIQKAIELEPRIERYHAQFAQINLAIANSIAQNEELSDEERQTIANLIQQSIAQAKVVVSLNPTKAAHWNLLRSIYGSIINVAQGADAWTIASGREAIKRDPRNPQLYLILGGVYYNAENWEQAVRQFEQAVTLKPDWANAHYNLAWAYYRTGNLVSATQEMQNVLQLLDNSSADYKTAQENYEAFKQELDEAQKNAQTENPDATTDVNSANDPAAKSVQDPLALPTPAGPVLSPPVELPADSAPETDITEEEQTSVTGTPQPTTSVTPGVNQ